MYCFCTPVSSAISFLSVQTEYAEWFARCQANLLFCQHPSTAATRYNPPHRHPAKSRHHFPRLSPPRPIFHPSSSLLRIHLLRRRIPRLPFAPPPLRGRDHHAAPLGSHRRRHRRSRDRRQTSLLARRPATHL